MAVPYGQVPIGDGLLPSGERAPFFILRHTLDLLSEYGPQEKYRDARFIEMAVTQPDAIYRGLRRPNQHEGLCYSIRPESDPDDYESITGVASLPRYGVVFLAFVEAGAMGYVVFDWEWREEDGDNPGCPAAADRDFAGRVYRHETD